MSPTYGIGIETSCDETAFALVKNGNEVLLNLIFSQVDEHSQYGGVVPELASRSHLEKFPFLLKKLIKYLEDNLISLNYVAVTVRPGLVGSLLVGYYVAKGIADFFQIRLVSIHHLEAHMYAASLENDFDWKYPFFTGLFSGGHTALFQVNAIGNWSLCGETLDDAAGEALDKAAQLLGLPYPGGPHIERAANKMLEYCKKNKVDIKTLINPLPIPLQKRSHETPLFSFSGLKTSLRYFLDGKELFFLEDIKDDSLILQTKEALAYFFQERVTSSICFNLEILLKQKIYEFGIIAGGVVANSLLKKKVLLLSKKYQTKVYFPSRDLCTDNAAMVATCGFYYYFNNILTNPEISSSTSFQNWICN